MEFGNKIIMEDMENIYLREYDWNLFEGRTVFISGAYGMLASYIVSFLMYLRIKKGLKVNVIAQGRNKIKAKKRFDCFWDMEGFRYLEMDITENISGLPHIDYVIHAASLASPQYYTVQPVEVITPNTVGTYHLLQLAKDCQSGGFLFFSTGDIYGKIGGSGDIYEDNMGYLDPLDEHSCYGESKRLGEALCAAFYREYGVRSVIARIGHTYGPTMDIQQDPRVFSSLMKCALNGKELILHSDGSAKRPFCYIADATAAFLLLLLKGKGGEAYNVTNTSQFLTICELAKIIADIPEEKVGVKFQARESRDTYLDNKLNHENKPVEYKLQKLGWRAEYDAVKGFSRVYQYLKCMMDNY